MAKRIITITGDLASGKSTVGKLLSQGTGWNLISIGMLQREKAASMNMDTTQFNSYMDEHKEIDDELDGEIRRIGETQENIIVDSRLAWYWIPDSLKIFVTVDIDKAAYRAFNDPTRKAETYKSIEEAKTKLISRTEIEIDRLKAKYGIDYSDVAHFDMVIDSTTIKAGNVCEKIMQKAKELALIK
jgi:CMP/dCMP kinase